MPTDPTPNLAALAAGHVPTAAEFDTWHDVLDALTGTWTSYVPTLTNMTLNNGSMSAKYTQEGKRVTCCGRIIFGSTTAVTGQIGVGVPVDAKDTIVCGSALLYDSNLTANRSGGECDFSAVDTLEFFAGTGGGPATATLPFTWQTSDQIRWNITYEAA